VFEFKGYWAQTLTGERDEENSEADLLPLCHAPQEAIIFIREGTLHAAYNLSWYPIQAKLRNEYSLILFFTDEGGVQKTGFLLTRGDSVLGKEYLFEDMVNAETPFNRLRGIGEIALYCGMSFEELYDIAADIVSKSGSVW
jgi:hypothetical protein